MTPCKTREAQTDLEKIHCEGEGTRGRVGVGPILQNHKGMLFLYHQPLTAPASRKKIHFTFPFNCNTGIVLKYKRF